jgi:hypothetical protein
MGEGKLTLRAMYDDAVAVLTNMGLAASDIEWSENCGPPKDADDFASEAIFVICNSGMKNTIARRIFDRIMPIILSGGSAHQGFGHEGKSTAIDLIWSTRAELLAGYVAAADKVEFCGSLPWIGGITKYHLAKNFGADVAKPDVHLQRLADHYLTTPQAMCEALSAETGLKARTIDLLLWRACAEGIINSRTGELSLTKGPSNG